MSGNSPLFLGHWDKLPMTNPIIFCMGIHFQTSPHAFNEPMNHNSLGVILTWWVLVISSVRYLPYLFLSPSPSSWLRNTPDLRRSQPVPQSSIRRSLLPQFPPQEAWQQSDCSWLTPCSPWTNSTHIPGGNDGKADGTVH